MVNSAATRSRGDQPAFELGAGFTTNLSAAVRLRLRAIARRRGGGLPQQRRGAAGTQRTTSADRCPRPRSTTDATRPPHLAPSASPTPPRPRSSVARGPRQRRRLRPFLASRTASVGALRAPNRRRPRTNARARSARRTRRGLRISRPWQALHRRGPVSSVARASAIAAAPASLSRVSRTASVIARDRTSLVCSAQLPRAGALTPRAATRTSPAARDSGRSAAAAANAPGQQCVRSRTTSGAMPRPVAAARRRIANTANLHRSSPRRRRAVSAKNWWRPRTYRSVDHTQSS